MIEAAATIIANDNIELATAFMQKTAVEKALVEIDKRLQTVINVSLFIWVFFAIHGLIKVIIREYEKQEPSVCTTVWKHVNYICYNWVIHKHD